jgi:hypothetical protein
MRKIVPKRRPADRAARAQKHTLPRPATPPPGSANAVHPGSGHGAAGGALNFSRAAIRTHPADDAAQGPPTKPPSTGGPGDQHTSRATGVECDTDGLDASPDQAAPGRELLAETHASSTPPGNHMELDNTPAAVSGDATPPTITKLTMTPPLNPDRFLVTTYRDGVITERPATLADVLQLDRDIDVDTHINEVTGRIVIRRQAGLPLEYTGRIPGVGPKVGRVLVDEIMWQPGEFLTVEDLTRRSALSSFDATDARAVCVTRMLRAFGEDRDHPYFFELAYLPWRIRWHPARSWRIIQRLA